MPRHAMQRERRRRTHCLHPSSTFSELCELCTALCGTLRLNSCSVSFLSFLLKSCFTREIQNSFREGKRDREHIVRARTAKQSHAVVVRPDQQAYEWSHGGSVQMNGRAWEEEEEERRRGKRVVPPAESLLYCAWHSGQDKPSGTRKDMTNGITLSL